MNQNLASLFEFFRRARLQDVENPFVLTFRSNKDAQRGRVELNQFRAAIRRASPIDFEDFKHVTLVIKDEQLLAYQWRDQSPLTRALAQAGIVQDEIRPLSDDLLDELLKEALNEEESN